MKGAGRKQAFHQANIVERLKSLLLLGPDSGSEHPKHFLRLTLPGCATAE